MTDRLTTCVVTCQYRVESNHGMRHLSAHNGSSHEKDRENGQKVPTRVHSVSDREVKPQILRSTMKKTEQIR